MSTTTPVTTVVTATGESTLTNRYLNLENTAKHEMDNLYTADLDSLSASVYRSGGGTVFEEITTVPKNRVENFGPDADTPEPDSYTIKDDASASPYDDMSDRILNS